MQRKRDGFSVFSFDLKEESEDKCLTERGREFQSTGPRCSCLIASTGQGQVRNRIMFTCERLQQV